MLARNLLAMIEAKMAVEKELKRDELKITINNTLLSCVRPVIYLSKPSMPKFGGFAQGRD